MTNLPDDSRWGVGPGWLTGRAAELCLLVFTAVVVASALLIVELNQGRGVSWDLAWFGAGGTWPRSGSRTW